MPKHRNKKVEKLRKHRDKLQLHIAKLERDIDRMSRLWRQARKEVQLGDTMRAYALLSDPAIYEREFPEHPDKEKLILEMTMLYKFLISEREFTGEIHHAVRLQDWLRVKALVSQHFYDMRQHDNMLKEFETRQIKDQRTMEDGT